MYRKKNSSLAYKAYQIAKKANRKVNHAELKNNAFSGTATGTAYNGGYIHELSSTSQGTLNNNRVGDRVFPTSVRVRLDWTDTNGFGSVGSTPVRVVIFRWVSESPTLGFGTATQVLNTAALNSFKSEDNRFQSEILYDQVWYNENADTQFCPNEIICKLKHPISYNESGTAANRNGIYMLILNNAAGTTYTYPFLSRMFFRDF